MDPLAVQAALRRQEAELAPIAHVLAALAAFPPQLDSTAWRGEAADAADRLETRLRAQLRHADAALEAAVRSTRAALAEVGP